MIKFKNEQAYQNASAITIANQLASQVSLTSQEFRSLKEDLVKKFMTEYSGELISTDANELAQMTQALKL